nr:MAG TPA: hypothetical protein [Caudoviricetes sp.]
MLLLFYRYNTIFVAKTQIFFKKIKKVVDNRK